jgi:hypothetical protein
MAKLAYCMLELLDIHKTLLNRFTYYYNSLFQSSIESIKIRTEWLSDIHVSYLGGKERKGEETIPLLIPCIQIHSPILLPLYSHPHLFTFPSLMPLSLACYSGIVVSIVVVVMVVLDRHHREPRRRPRIVSGVS